MKGQPADQSQAVQQPQRFGTTQLLLLLGLIVLTIGAFASGVKGTFLLDDAREIVLNQDIRSLSNVGDLLLKSRRPVVEISLALNYAVANKDQNGIPSTTGFHIVNILIHAAAAVVLFGIIRRTLLLPRLPAVFHVWSSWIAFGSAAMWAVHPLQTESVTYIVQRAESLMGLFVLLTLYCFIVAAHAEKRAKLFYILSVASCVLAMGSKAVAIGAPILVLSYDWIFLSGSPLAALRRRLGYYIALGATWAITFLTGVAPGVLGLKETTGPATVGFLYEDITWWQYAMSQPGVILHYLRLAIWPAGQCLDYNWPVAESATQIALPTILIAALGLVSLFGIIRRRPWGFLGAWFFVILAPTSSFIPIKDLAFEHRMYLPLAAVTTLITAGAVLLVARFGRTKNIDPGGLRLIQGVMIGAGILALVITTSNRNEAYLNEGEMWRDITTKRPTNLRAWSNYGFYLHTRGDYEAAADVFRQGLSVEDDGRSANFREALKINLGNTLRRLGKMNQAVEQYEEVLAENPDAWNARYMLSLTQKDTGDVDGLIATSEALISELNSLNLDRNPQAREALYATYVNLATALVMKARFEESLPLYDRAAELKPDAAAVLSEKGATLIRLERYAEAEQVLRKSIELQPRYIPALYNLALVYARLDRPGEAALYFQQVLDLDPNNAAARQGLRNVGGAPNP